MPRALTTHIDSPQEFGLRLRTARERAGHSQRQLAFPGCTAAYISRLEAGDRVPSLQMVNQLALRLAVSQGWLATGSERIELQANELVEADVALRIGELEEAERIYRGHLLPGDPARSTALAGLGQIAFREGRTDDAIMLLEESLQLRDNIILVDPSAVDTLGRGYATCGLVEEAIALFQRGVAEAAEIGVSLEELRFSVLLANALIDAGSYGRAEDALSRVIQIADEIGDPMATARVYWTQSRLHAHRYEPQLAGRFARRALEILERTENEAYIGMAYHLLAFAEIESGNPGEALTLLQRGRSLFGRELRELDEARFSIEEARALLALGRHTEAALVAAKALELLDNMSPVDQGRAYLTLADVFLGVGDRERAKFLLEQSSELLAQRGTRFAVEAGSKLAGLLEADGDVDGALQVLKRAVSATDGSAPT